MRTANWAALWQAVLAGLSYVSAGLIFNGAISVKTAGLFALITGGLQAATAGYYSYSTKTTITGPTIVQPTTLARTDVQPPPEQPASKP